MFCWHVFDVSHNIRVEGPEIGVLGLLLLLGEGWMVSVFMC